MSPTTPEAALEGIGTDLDEPSQVILYNDDVHTFEYVIVCLMRVFHHTAFIAQKVALEAHTRGRAIAEVEARSEALKHAKMLLALGLKAEVESI